MSEILILIGSSIILFAMVFLLFVPVLLRPSRQEQRLQAVLSHIGGTQHASTARQSIEEQLLWLAAGLRAKLGLSLGDRAQKRLECAGFRTAAASEFYFAATWLTPLLGAFVGSFMPANTIFYILILTIVGYIVPDFVLSSKVTKRKNLIRRALPDAIDLLVICVDAGLGFDQALLRVCEELSLSAPELHHEFLRVQSEQRAGRPRLEAWQSIMERVRVEEIKIFVGMLTQSERFGTPISKGLSRFADDLRVRRRQQAEEAAAKTKIKIIFPLVFFIFPSLFIVLLAPALLSMFHELTGVVK